MMLIVSNCILTYLYIIYGRQRKGPQGLPSTWGQAHEHMNDLETMSGTSNLVAVDAVQALSFPEEGHTNPFSKLYININIPFHIV